jgi:hypothetical protein
MHWKHPDMFSGVLWAEMPRCHCRGSTIGFANGRSNRVLLQRPRYTSEFMSIAKIGWLQLIAIIRAASFVSFRTELRHLIAAAPSTVSVTAGY